MCNMKVRLSFLIIIISMAITGTSFSEMTITTNYSEKELTLYEKLDIYSKLKYSPKDSIIAASSFGFGIGSFIQNDEIGGIIGMGADLAGLTLLSVGYGSIPPNQYINLNNSSGSLMLTGALVFIASRIFQITRPMIIAEQKNNDLLIKLGISQKF